MIRDFHLADWFTIANALCGMGAVLAVMACLTDKNAHGLLWAAMLIPAAFLFDVCDGHIARRRQTQSALGPELDSLAGVISFGVAPAALAFGAGRNGFRDCPVLMYFVACGVSRLARYNITVEALAVNASGQVKYFEGTPIPSSVLLVALLTFAAWRHPVDEAIWFGHWKLGPWQLHPLVLLFALPGSLMISKNHPHSEALN